MAFPRRPLPITPLPQYLGGMTEDAGEPTNADLLAFMRDGFAHVMTELAAVKADVAAVDAKADDLRGEIRATEATLTSRIDAVQQVVRSVKADIAAHVHDPNLHRPAA